MNLTHIHLMLDHVPVLGTTLLAASLIVSGLMAWTANLGGKIRHTEIRSNASPALVGVNRDKD